MARSIVTHNRTFNWQSKQNLKIHYGFPATSMGVLYAGGRVKTVNTEGFTLCGQSKAYWVMTQRVTDQGLTPCLKCVELLNKWESNRGYCEVQFINNLAKHKLPSFMGV